MKWNSGDGSFVPSVAPYASYDVVGEITKDRPDLRGMVARASQLPKIDKTVNVGENLPRGVERDRDGDLVCVHRMGSICEDCEKKVKGGKA